VNHMQRRIELRTLSLGIGGVIPSIKRVREFGALARIEGMHARNDLNPEPEETLHKHVVKPTVSQLYSYCFPISHNQTTLKQTPFRTLGFVLCFALCF